MFNLRDEYLAQHVSRLDESTGGRHISIYPMTTQGAEFYGRRRGSLEKPAETPISTRSSKYCKLLRTGFMSFFLISIHSAQYMKDSKILLNECLLVYFATLSHSAEMIQPLYISHQSTRPSHLIIMFQENPDYSFHTFCLDRLPGKLKQVLQSICWRGSFTQIYVECCRFTWFCQSEFLSSNFLLLLQRGKKVKT